jgi:ribosomal protein S12
MGDLCCNAQPYLICLVADQGDYQWVVHCGCKKPDSALCRYARVWLQEARQCCRAFLLVQHYWLLSEQAVAVAV